MAWQYIQQTIYWLHQTILKPLQTRTLMLFQQMYVRQCFLEREQLYDYRNLQEMYAVFSKAPFGKVKESSVHSQENKKRNCENRSSVKLARYNIVKCRVYAARPAFHFVVGRVNKAQNLLWSRMTSFYNSHLLGGARYTAFFNRPGNEHF